ncbi:hypothetical protein Nepgr_024783 [Nepenthes gracilis]|uniref:Uncharacterized protein n=1 Tax=Nepenthes gracilis TaxID=150966 RepID=A0AAD3T3W1_NEPGR|nr:hypothetical protein Nepgr_024783 [Nepenthes gracilis]
MLIGSGTHMLFLNAELGPNDDGRSAALHSYYIMDLAGMVDGSLCCVLSLDGSTPGAARESVPDVSPAGNEAAGQGMSVANASPSCHLGPPARCLRLGWVLVDAWLSLQFVPNAWRLLCNMELNPTWCLLLDTVMGSLMLLLAVGLMIWSAFLPEYVEGVQFCIPGLVMVCCCTCRGALLLVPLQDMLVYAGAPLLSKWVGVAIDY